MASDNFVVANVHLDELTAEIVNAIRERRDEIDILRVRINTLQNIIDIYKVIIDTDNKRLSEAGNSVGLNFGCDTPEIMANEIISLRNHVAILNSKILEQDNTLNNTVHELSRMEIAKDVFMIELDKFIEKKDDEISNLKIRIDELKKEIKNELVNKII